MTTSPPPSPAENGVTTAGARARRAGPTAQFLLAVGREVGEEGLTPAALARALVQVLPVDGAGMSSLVRDLRMPLGASSDDVARAEELQTTLGEGPCLHAAAIEASAVLGLDELRTRWPLYTTELTRKTPFKAIVAVPLRAPGNRVFAALDLYANSPQLDESLDLAEIERHVAPPAAALLSSCVDEADRLDDAAAPPDWYQTSAGRRHNAWVVIGMVMAHRAVPERDVISLLRAHAYAQDRSLDDVAEDVVKGRLAPDDLAG